MEKSPDQKTNEPWQHNSTVLPCLPSFKGPCLPHFVYNVRDLSQSFDWENRPNTRDTCRIAIFPRQGNRGARTSRECNLSLDGYLMCFKINYTNNTTSYAQEIQEHDDDDDDTKFGEKHEDKEAAVDDCSAVYVANGLMVF